MRTSDKERYKVTSLLWFRNDLRVHDNPALSNLLADKCESKKAIWFATPQQWRLHHLADVKIDLIKRHVAYLSAQLADLGIELEIRETADFASQIKDLIAYCHANQVETVYVNHEVEINEVERDVSIATQTNLVISECDVIVAKGTVTKADGEMFKVFTPFKKAWLSRLKMFGLAIDDSSHISVNESDPKVSETLRLLGAGDKSNKWPSIDTVLTKVLPQFLEHKVSNYHTLRDIPGTKGTSGLSPYFAIGALSPRYVMKLLLNKYPDIIIATDTPEFSWVNELIWRDFYRHLLFHFPKLCKHQNFNSKYDQLPWPNDHTLFKAWCQGKTGYPIVDAAMNQLLTTGWMHNRLRMIVASFLTKHLLVDWRLGEQFFMEHLIDGDLAANNGGWQWAAGTGCDAQPYFRIFNPITQSQKFDPEGRFIRKYLPELADMPSKEIHFPHEYISANKLSVYWPAIVEHKAAREQALAFYKQ